MKQCIKCNKELNDDSIYCDSCGAEQVVENKTETTAAEINDKNENDVEIQKSSLEEYDSNPDGLKKGIICWVIAIIFAAIQIILGIGGFFGSFIPIGLGIYGAILFFTRHQMKYKAVCPHCKHEFGFSVDSLGEDCPKCKKRIIINNDKFEIVE